MKKGQRVLVWSLQSFNGGGFLNGTPAFLRQEQGCNDGSILLCVMRNKGGRMVIDESYEVYPEQVKAVDKADWPADIRLKKFRKIIMQDERIK